MDPLTEEEEGSGEISPEPLTLNKLDPYYQLNRVERRIDRANAAQRRHKCNLKYSLLEIQKLEYMEHRSTNTPTVKLKDPFSN